MYNIVSPKEEVIKSVALCAGGDIRIENRQDLQGFLGKTANLPIERADFYQQSVFNHVEKSERRRLIYNTLYHSLVSLTNEEYRGYLGQVGCTDEEESFFVENGLWVPEGLDERAGYQKLAEYKHLYGDQETTIIFAVTQACNACCAYCYEKGIEPQMFPTDRIEELVSFINRLDWQKAVHITWFGGEPLLNATLIDAVAQKLGEAGIPFYSSMISNGSLITEGMAEEKFPLWRLKHIQITVDGTAEEYERIKAYKDGQNNHFEQVISNIACAAEHQVSVDVRLNIDRNNAADIITAFHQLEERFGDNERIRYYPAFINGSADDMPEEDRADVMYDLLRQMKDPAKIMGVWRMYSLPLSAPCHRSTPHAYSIDAEGNVYKCEHDIGHSEKKIGTVADGLPEEDLRCQPPKLRSICRDCVFLPNCYGGCESNYLKDAIPCMIDKYIIPAYMRVILDK